jgi:hypothetical protein
MTAQRPRPARISKPQAVVNTRTVFRDFVRQLEKLDTRQPRPAREGSR